MQGRSSTPRGQWLVPGETQGAQAIHGVLKKIHGKKHIMKKSACQHFCNKISLYFNSIFPMKLYILSDECLILVKKFLFIFILFGRERQGQ